MRSVEQLLSGDWAIDARSLEAFAADVRLAAAAPIEDAAPKSEEPEAPAGSMALVRIHGPIVKSAPEWLGIMGIEATGALETAAVIHSLANDPEVDGVVFDFDSPGGAVQGTDILARAIAELSSKKKTVAYVSGMCCSAAYWVASQASEIVSERTAASGSIGVYAKFVDSSSAAQAQGLSVHVVKSGEHKGDMEPGTEITDKILAKAQEHVDALADIFIAAVSDGRNMKESEVRKLATGESWLAADALKFGLIDSVGTFGDAMLSLLNKGEEMKKEETEEATSAEESELPQVEASAETPVAAEDDKEEEEEAPEEEAPAEEEEDEEEASELAALQAEVAALKASLSEMKESQKAEVLGKAVASGKITPKMEASVNHFAEACGADVAKLQDFVDALPVVTHAAAAGTPAAETQGLSEDAVRFAKKYGMDPEQFALGAEV